MDGLAYTHLYLANESPVTPCWGLNLRGLAIAPLGLVLALILGLPSVAEVSCTAVDCAANATEWNESDRDVVALQDNLKVLGYFPKEVRSTGYYGDITRESVRQFQQAVGLPVDGIADAVTRGEIHRAIAQKKAQSTENAAKSITTLELQSRLKTLGYFPAKVRATGYYGPITQASVRQFQLAYGLPADGIAGSSTVAKLEEVTQQATSASRGGAMRRFSEDRGRVPQTPVPSQQPNRPAGFLRPGDVGAAVVEAKRQLDRYGYTAGRGNLYDTQMVVAVKRFQEDKGLEVDGLIGTQTEQLLYAAERGLPTLQEGDRGHLVQLVQFQLNLVPTGEFDAVTAATVKAFQEKRGLEPTGIVNGLTHQALKTHLARLSLIAR